MGRTVNFNEHLPVLEVADGCIVSKRGDLTVGFVLDKPEIFTLGVEDYSRLHESWVKAVKLLAPGTILHMQDVYWGDHFGGEPRAGAGGERGSTVR